MLIETDKKCKGFAYQISLQAFQHIHRSFGKILKSLAGLVCFFVKRREHQLHCWVVETIFKPNTHTNYIPMPSATAQTHTRIHISSYLHNQNYSPVTACIKTEQQKKINTYLPLRKKINICSVCAKEGEREGERGPITKAAKKNSEQQDKITETKREIKQKQTEIKLQVGGRNILQLAS